MDWFFLQFHGGIEAPKELIHLYAMRFHLVIISLASLLFGGLFIACQTESTPHNQVADSIPSPVTDSLAPLPEGSFPAPTPAEATKTVTSQTFIATRLTEPALYQLSSIELPGSSRKPFISLSDSYRSGPSHGEPQYAGLAEGRSSGSDKSFLLSPKGKARFLERCQIALTDSIFIYSYSADSIFAFPVEATSVAATLDAYAEAPPYEMYEYHIGFMLDTTIAGGLISVASSNPFVAGAAIPLIFHPTLQDSLPRVIQELFPTPSSSPTDSSQLALYYCPHPAYTFYLQEYTAWQYYTRDSTYYSHPSADSRRIVVLDHTTQ